MAEEVDVDGVWWKTVLSVKLRHLVREHRADRSVGVLDLEELTPRLKVAQGWLTRADEIAVENSLESMVLLLAADGAGGRVKMVRWHEKRTEVEPFVEREFRLLQQINASDEIIDLSDSQTSHNLSCFLGNHEEVVDNVFRLSSEHLAKVRILSGNSHWASVEVAFAHHDAAHCDERSGCEAVLLSSKHRGLDNIKPSLKLSIGLYDNTVTKAVEDQGLVGLGETKLPWETSRLDSSPLGRSGTSVVSGNEDVISFALRYAGGNDTDTNFRDQLDTDASVGVGVLQVVNELGKVFNTVDVVVRWW
mmetsp:Transcript_6971/g.13276  ORF Transcript_6971/g.13276 Transcript_6971/m.13276 type:complete len:305 (+) Transcript_6971:2716-3630(+)